MTLTDWLVVGLALIALGAVAMLLVQASIIRELRRDRASARLDEQRLRSEVRQLLDYARLANPYSEAWPARRAPRPPAAVVHLNPARRPR